MKKEKIFYVRPDFANGQNNFFNYGLQCTESSLQNKNEVLPDIIFQQDLEVNQQDNNQQDNYCQDVNQQDNFYFEKFENFNINEKTKEENQTNIIKINNFIYNKNINLKFENEEKSYKYFEFTKNQNIKTQILISYAKNISQIKLKHRLNLKKFSINFIIIIFVFSSIYLIFQFVIKIIFRSII